MKLNGLEIDNINLSSPIIQGGMAVRISTAPLAAAVSNEGGLGVIAASGMTVDELKNEIRKAREMTEGYIGVNIMNAVREFADLFKASLEEKIDVVFSGAGFSRDMFVWGREKNVPVVPIVSTARLGILSQKLGASAVVVEGKEAGGHLGTDRPLLEILKEVKEKVKNIPVIAAGGIMEGKDILEAIKSGADGVQMATIFAASEESNASDEFKSLYLKSNKQDVVLVDSPVGLPGRGLRNEFFNKTEKGLAKVEKCDKCLKKCNRNFCILEALNNATKNGNFEKALVFAGEGVGKVKEILSVKTIFNRLLGEIKENS